MSLESNESSPRGLHWFLLVVAIIVVIVLFVILTKGKENKNVEIIEPSSPVVPELIITPNAPVDWSDTNVDEVRETRFTISANTRVQVNDVIVRVDGDDDDAVGVTAQETCTNENTIIDENMSCSLRLKYEPEHALPTTNVDVAIKWTDFATGAETDDSNAITIVIGAREPQKSEPVSKPNLEPVVDEEPEPIYEPEYPTYDFKQDFDDISPDVDFDIPMPTYNFPTPVTTPTKPIQSIGSGCSEFSFPGYNISGVHSGWIKPFGGAYYYYPFSDVNCETPTGVYNPDTGYVMDISNPARRIGSDAEHIRLVIQEKVPELGERGTRKRGNRARQKADTELNNPEYLEALKARQPLTSLNPGVHIKPNEIKKESFIGSDVKGSVFSSMPYDRTFVLRQYKPIPATIVSDIQADKAMLEGGLPVRATVDRNVYSDNGRTVIIPTGTLMLGHVVGDLPGPYKAVGRMEIQWYQFIRPDGVEFNFAKGQFPFSADSQGRKGVPGHGSTDYLQQFVMPMLTAIVPAAVNLIAPISDGFVNQIDLDNNTVVQSGTVRSSELAKNEIITAWNNVATKLLVDVMDNTTPPFSIAAGTRITVFSPVDLFVTCGDDGTRNCAFHPYGTNPRYSWGSEDSKLQPSTDMEELIGQVRSLMQSSIQKDCCDCAANESCTPKMNPSVTGQPLCNQYSFATIDFYCRSFGTYMAVNNAKQEAVWQNQQQQGVVKQDEYGNNTKEYNTQVLGLEYNEDGTIKNPFKKETPAPAQQQNTSVVTCGDGANPDANGCCPGETYTDMGDQGFNCCPDAGGDCFPPIAF